MKKLDWRYLVSNCTLLLFPILISAVLVINSSFLRQFRRSDKNLPLYLFFFVGQFLLFAWFIWWFFLKPPRYSNFAVLVGMLEMVICLSPPVLKQLSLPLYHALYEHLQIMSYFYFTFLTLYMLLFVRGIRRRKRTDRPQR